MSSKIALNHPRLSGDYNPLHSDPSYAKTAGFPRPILHGLCTLGYATRAVIASSCGGEPSLVQSVQGRFLLHVFPGETLITEMWKDEDQNRVDYKLKVKERNKVVLAGSITLRPTLSRLRTTALNHISVASSVDSREFLSRKLLALVDRRLHDRATTHVNRLSLWLASLGAHGPLC
ncbi:hypothetical protein M758_1G066500 [Ceratodon purpureus]|nr:hypothetical protein M758_1G066500 [Ceratodon purpureus]